MSEHCSTEKPASSCAIRRGLAWFKPRLTGPRRSTNAGRAIRQGFMVFMFTTCVIPVLLDWLSGEFGSFSVLLGTIVVAIAIWFMLANIVVDWFSRLLQRPNHIEFAAVGNDSELLRRKVLVICISRFSGSSTPDHEGKLIRPVPAVMIERTKPERVLFLGTRQTAEVKVVEKLRRFIDQDEKLTWKMPAGEFSSTLQLDGWNLAEDTELVEQGLKEILKIYTPDDVLVDLTNGTKPMSIAAYAAAQRLGIDSHYLAMDYKYDEASKSSDRVAGSERSILLRERTENENSV